MIQTAPFVPGSQTSEEAAYAIAPRIGSIREWLCAILETPRTCFELCQVTGLDKNTVSPRIVELHRDGRIGPSGITRPGPNGGEAIAWVRGASSTGPRVSSTPSPVERECGAAPIPETVAPVYEHLLSRINGSTDDEMQAILGYHRGNQTAQQSARAWLVKHGLAAAGESDGYRVTRRTRAGNPATVWVALAAR